MEKNTMKNLMAIMVGMQWTLFWALQSKRSQKQNISLLYLCTEIIAHIITAKLLVLVVVFFCALMKSWTKTKYTEEPTKRSDQWIECEQVFIFCVGRRCRCCSNCCCCCVWLTVHWFGAMVADNLMTMSNFYNS